MFIESGFELWSARRQADGGYFATRVAPGQAAGQPFYDEPRARLFAARYISGTDAELVSFAVYAG